MSEVGAEGDRSFGTSGGCKVSPQTLTLLICVQSFANFDEIIENRHLSNVVLKFDLFSSSPKTSERTCHNSEATFLT